MVRTQVVDRKGSEEDSKGELPKGPAERADLPREEKTEGLACNGEAALRGRFNRARLKIEAGDSSILGY